MKVGVSVEGCGGCMFPKCVNVETGTRGKIRGIDVELSDK